MTRAEMQKQWNDQVHAISRAGRPYFASQVVADKFVERHVVPAWETVTGCREDEDIFARFGITPTQRLILHLFGRGVHRVAVGNARCPVFAVWPPSNRLSTTGEPICMRSIPTNDVARLIGRSRSAVDVALSRFKRRGGGSDLHDYGLCNVLSLETGVMLDGIFQPQTAFPFMYEVHEYAAAREFAHQSRVANSDFVNRQREWCQQALVAKGLLPLPMPTQSTLALGKESRSA